MIPTELLACHGFPLTQTQKADRKQLERMYLDARLRQYPRYLAAVEVRRDKLASQVHADRLLMDQIHDLQSSWLHQVQALPAGRPQHAALREARWMLEEWRVQLWAQHLGTAQKVSDQRIRKVLG